MSNSPILFQHFIYFLINILGWLYFLIWSISFYGQVFTLLRLKSALGMSSNYLLINLSGYIFYSVYNLYGYLNSNNNETGKVNDTDLMFSIHSIIVYMITCGLFLYYPHVINISKQTKIYLSIQWSIFIIFGIISIDQNNSYTFKISQSYSLGYIQLLGYFKMCSTLLKHPPQIYYNYKRKSTKGWSIQGMIMDAMGGLFSFIQLILQLYLDNEMKINVTKLLLSVFSMSYDIVYMVQHYVLYGGKNEEKDEEKYKQEKAIKEISNKKYLIINKEEENKILLNPEDQ